MVRSDFLDVCAFRAQAVYDCVQWPRLKLV